MGQLKTTRGRGSGSVPGAVGIAVSRRNALLMGSSILCLIQFGRHAAFAQEEGGALGSEDGTAGEGGEDYKVFKPAVAPPPTLGEYAHATLGESYRAPTCGLFSPTSLVANATNTPTEPPSYLASGTNSYFSESNSHLFFSDSPDSVERAFESLTGAASRPGKTQDEPSRESRDTDRVYDSFGRMWTYGQPLFDVSVAVTASSSFGQGPQLNVQTEELSYEVSHGYFELARGADGRWSLGVGISPPKPLHYFGELTLSVPFSTPSAFEFSVQARVFAVGVTAQVADGPGMGALYGYVEQSIRRWMSMHSAPIGR